MTKFLSDEEITDVEGHLAAMRSFTSSQSSTYDMLSWIWGSEIMTLQDQDLTMSQHVSRLSSRHKPAYYRSCKEGEENAVE